MTDHDQRFKNLLKEFFSGFFELFFSEWAGRFDFTQVEWLDKEIFTDPPQGERRYLDLVARVPVRQVVVLPRGEPAEHWIVLIHVEIESEDKVAPLRPRMFDYYESLRRQHGLPVLPIGLYLRVGLDGTGWDVYEEHFWEHRLLHFEYAYVGLPALDAEQYATGENLLGVALAALMRIPEERRAELRAEALKRVLESRENDNRRFLALECIEAYWGLDEAQRRVFDQLLASEKYQGVRQMMATTFERGLERARRQDLQILLEEKFGSPSPHVLQRLEAWPAEQLEELFRAAVRAKSLKELGLED
ncbi:MAG TPA: hypothetical protein VNK04_04055 [Gemmataceae bacterium]|nr:hypothetical protein [Gemmataceae bacterium]